MTIPLRVQDWPLFLQELKRFDYRPSPETDTLPPGFYRFRVDLSEWRLRFYDEVPLFFVRAAETDEMPDAEVAEVIRDWRRRRRTSQDVLVAIDRPAPELKKEAARETFSKIVVLDAEQLDEITASNGFTHTLQRKVRAWYDILELVPYHHGGHPKRIFGRRTELSRILRHEDANFAVTGIRRVGKTTILFEARRRMIERNRDADPPLFFDCSTFQEPLDFIKALVRDLDVRQFSRRETAGWAAFDCVKFLTNASRARRGPITLFLDESDQLLALAHRHTELLNLIRSSISNSSCRYIMAGFKELMLETTNAKSPLYLGLEMIRVQPFDYDETKEMLEAPLTSVGVRFEDVERTATAVYDDIRGLPPLVQFYFSELSKTVQRRGDYVVRVEDVGRIHAEPQLKSLVIDTFRDSVSTEDQLLTYVLLERYGVMKHSYAQSEMYEAMNVRSCHLNLNDLDRACDRLELAGLFTREGHSFRFTLPVFAKLIARDYDLKFQVDTLRRELKR